jgi:hypothetical protein
MFRSFKRPRHATIVAYLALILAVGGGTFAVAAKHSKQINGSKLKKRSVAGAKLKKNTVTGTEVNENKLGKVPSAKSADTAGSASTADTAKVAESLTKLSPRTSTKVNSSASGVSYEAGLAAASSVTLYEDSHFRVYGKCFVDESGPFIEGVLLIATKQDGAIFDAEDDELAGDPEFLNIATPETEREIDDEGEGENEASIQESEDYAATAADGYSLTGDYQIAVKSGNLAGGNGLYGPGEVCIFDSSVYHS